MCIKLCKNDLCNIKKYKYKLLFLHFTQTT